MSRQFMFETKDGGGTPLVLEYDEQNLRLFLTNLDGTKSYVSLQVALSVTPPPSFKEYTAIISQTGTAAPSATIITNLLSAPPLLARTAEGTYTFTLTSAFTANKTIATCDVVAMAVGDEFKADFTRTSAHVLTLKVRDSAGVLIDGFGGFVRVFVFN